MGRPVFDSEWLPVVLFFAANPEEELDSREIETKFGINIRYVTDRLGRSVRAGMLECESNGPGRGKLAIYRAGLVLLEMRGETKILEERRQAQADRRATPRETSEDRRVAVTFANAPLMLACAPVGRV